MQSPTSKLSPENKGGKSSQNLSTPNLEFSSVDFGYSDQSQVLNNLSFEVYPGESLLIHGPSGCGKTTLLNLCGGILLPNQGTVKIRGIDTKTVSSKKRDDIRCQNIGYLFQIFNLIPYLSVIDNVILPLHFSKARQEGIDDSFENAGLALLKKLGIEELANKKAKDLSLGQQQRAAAARAFIGAPPIILADEPNSSLDERASQQLLNLLIKEKPPSSSVLLVSHDSRLKQQFPKHLSLDSNPNAD